MSVNRKPIPPPAQPASPEWRTDAIIIAVLAICALAAYARVFGLDFVNFDDDLYMYDNPSIRTGLSLANIGWALTAVVAGNWMPVTLISLMLDAQLFGVHAGPQHVMNVAIHALAAAFLFLALRRATGMRWFPAFAAMAFAVHPLHVESVAWIAERKDVLSALFWFAGLYAYARYAEQPSRGRYLAVAGLFALGLMSKPMVVTFPFTLLLFDVWPLRRFSWPKSVIEKLPMFGLTAIVAVVSYLVQDSAGATRAVPFGLRLENALISVVTYLWQTLWPTRLAVFYPYTAEIPGWQVALAAAVIAGVSWIAIRNLRPRPWLAVGWFWFLGTLSPVIGLVQVGNQAHADRYMYVPMVGLALMLAGIPFPRREFAIAGAALCAVWMALTFQQTAHWRNSQTLYEHAIEATSGNWLAEYNLGHYLMDQKRITDAIPHFEAVLRIRPDHFDADNNLGACLMYLGRKEDAARYFEAAIRAEPGFADAHYNLALDLLTLPGRLADAEAELKATLRYAPDHEQAHNSLGLLMVRSGRSPEAVPHFEANARLHPSAQAEYNLGAVLATIAGREAEAVTHLEAAQRLRPDARTAKLIEMLKQGSR